MQKVYNDASLGYVQTDSFDVKVDSLQLVGDSLLDYNFANPSSPSSTPSTAEDDEVESYFE
jgi:hypothetical protein